MCSAWPPQQAFPKAETAAQRSLQIDESLSDAHSSLGDVKFLYQWDFVGAEKEFQRALELNPNSLGARAAYADFLIAMGWNFGEVVFPTAVVPEPSTFLLAGSGLLTILARKRRARKKN